MKNVDVIERLKSGNQRFQAEGLKHELQDRPRRDSRVEIILAYYELESGSVEFLDN